MKKESIPAISQGNTLAVLAALKENVEVITGRRTAEIAQLKSMATTTDFDIFNKINEIIVRLNSSGT